MHCKVFQCVNRANYGMKSVTITYVLNSNREYFHLKLIEKWWIINGTEEMMDHFMKSKENQFTSSLASDKDRKRVESLGYLFIHSSNRCVLCATNAFSRSFPQICFWQGKQRTEFRGYDTNFGIDSKIRKTP